MLDLTPQQLDQQSKIKIDRWIEVGSEECRMLDETPSFTAKIIRLGFQKPEFLFADNFGRLWGKSEDGKEYFPFHFESGSKLIGYKIIKRAPN